MSHEPAPEKSNDIAIVFIVVVALLAVPLALGLAGGVAYFFLQGRPAPARWATPVPVMQSDEAPPAPPMEVEPGAPAP
jgi:hypothetical protein